MVDKIIGLRPDGTLNPETIAAVKEVAGTGGGTGSVVVTDDGAGTYTVGGTTIMGLTTQGQLPAVAKKYVDDGLAGKANTTHTHTWAEVTGKPTTFTPEAHTHAIADVSGLSAALASPTVTALTGDLNNVTSPGLYLQTASAQATLALNYPAEIAGSLVVTGNGGTMVYQEYTLYAAAGSAAGVRYLRTRYNSTWGAWRQQALTQDVEATAAYRTVDGRLMEATPLQAFHLKAMSPVTVPTKVIVLGSSSANGGYPTHTSLQWSWRLAARMTPNPVRRLEDVTSETRAGVWWFNGAQGGTTSSTYITDQRMANVKSLAPDVVIHMVGANDWANSVPLATYRDTLRSKLVEISAAVPGAVQVLVHQGGRADTTKSIAWDSYGQVMRDLAAEDPTRRMFINANATFARAGFPSPDPWGMLIADKMHVADEGNKLYADIIGAALGIPDQGFTVPQVRTITLAASKTYTVSDNLGSVTLPAKAYPRRVVVQGSLYVKATGQADVRVDLSGGGFVADAVSTYSRVLPGVENHSVPFTHTGFLPAHTEGTAVVGVALASGASMYVSGSAQYSTATVTEFPV